MIWLKFIKIFSFWDQFWDCWVWVLWYYPGVEKSEFHKNTSVLNVSEHDQNSVKISTLNSKNSWSYDHLKKIDFFFLPKKIDCVPLTS